MAAFIPPCNAITTCLPAEAPAVAEDHAVVELQLFLQPSGHSLGTGSFPVHYSGSRPAAFRHPLRLCSDTPFHCCSGICRTKKKLFVFKALPCLCKPQFKPLGEPQCNTVFLSASFSPYKSTTGGCCDHKPQICVLPAQTGSKKGKFGYPISTDLPAFMLCSIFFITYSL